MTNESTERMAPVAMYTRPMMCPTPMADPELQWAYDCARQAEAKGEPGPTFHWTTILRLHATILEQMRRTVAAEAATEIAREVKVEIAVKGAFAEKGGKKR